MMMDDAIIFDIDGTLSVINKERQELIKKRSWDKFHRLSICADVNHSVRNMLVMFAATDHRIILLTARPEHWRESTVHWLDKNEIYYDFLYMRKDGDKRRSNHSKRENLRHIMGFYNIKLAYDDRQQDIDMFEKMGIRTVKVGGQYEGK